MTSRTGHVTRKRPQSTKELRLQRARVAPEHVPTQRAEDVGRRVFGGLRLHLGFSVARVYESWPGGAFLARVPGRLSGTSGPIRLWNRLVIVSCSSRLSWRHMEEAKAARTSKTDDEIPQEIIRRSTASYAGTNLLRDRRDQQNGGRTSPKTLMSEVRIQIRSRTHTSVLGLAYP